MQPLTAAPRGAFTGAQIIALVSSSSVKVKSGTTLLDGNNNPLQDVSTNLVSWALARNNTAAVQGTATFVISQEVQGGVQRMQPYVELTGDDGTGTIITARFNEGVYVLTTPTLPLNQTPPTYTITAYDLIYLLNLPIGDTYTVPAGISYQVAAQQAIAAAGVAGSQLILPAGAASALVPTSLVFSLADSESYTYLDVFNELMVGVNYVPLWADWDGNFQSSVYINPDDLTPEYVFDLTQGQGQIVSDPRTLSSDLWGAPNWFRFVNQNVGDPVEGDGQFTYVNQSSGPASVGAVGRYFKYPVQYVTVVDQPTLVAYAQQQIQQQSQLVAQLEVTLSPFPLSWHNDVFGYVDADMPDGQTSVVVQSTGWSLTSDGSDGAQTWQVV